MKIAGLEQIRDIYERGKFRVIRCLLMQVERNLEINQMRTVAKEVVEVARENLVSGQA
ncbi:MAG: hypothetical protein M3Z08_15780 [Chloroflexota bacterium]|nr:hypothetical protein [Chloroflexota bacterium]